MIIGQIDLRKIHLYVHDRLLERDLYKMHLLFGSSLDAGWNDLLIHTDQKHPIDARCIIG